MPSLALFAVVMIAGAPAAGGEAPAHPWRPASAEGGSLAERFPAPAGFRRVAVEPGSFAAWVRGLPLAPKGTPVRSYRGAVLDERPLAVIDLDVGARDLQQCADSLIRLRAEYLWSQGRADDIAFRFTSGDLARWKDYRRGVRPVIKPRKKVRWRERDRAEASRASFRRYLDLVFTYAGTWSLARYTPRVAWSALRPGDFLVDGGFPGHAVMVLDVAVGPDGARRALLGQGFMPAQSFHVVPTPSGGAWHPLDEGRAVSIAAWPAGFGEDSARRFPE